MGVGAGASALVAPVGAALGQAAAVQWVPTKPVHWIVPYAAGGFADRRARQLAAKLQDLWKQTVVVDNRPGAGGVTGTALVARASADGTTVGMGNFASLAVNVSLMKSIPYDPLRDLATVVLIEKSPQVLMVHPSVPAKSVQELVAYAKTNPGRLSVGSSGVGGSQHLAGEMLRMLAEIEITHVPYKGGAPMTTDLLAGHIPMGFEGSESAIEEAQSGRLRPIAVSSDRRIPALANVPTFAESGLAGLVVSNWQGVVVPRNTPREAVLGINAAVNQVLASPEVRESILAQGNEIGGGTPAAFADLVRSEIPRWAEVIKKADIKPV